MWRLWTKGWGPRGWWDWVVYSTPMWAAFALPRQVAYWAYIRVMAASGRAPDHITFDEACAAWERGEGR